MPIRLRSGAQAEGGGYRRVGAAVRYVRKKDQTQRQSGVVRIAGIHESARANWLFKQQHLRSETSES